MDAEKIEKFDNEHMAMLQEKYPEKFTIKHKLFLTWYYMQHKFYNKRTIGLARVVNDTEILAQIHYMLVYRDYQGQSIVGKMIEYIKEKYKISK